MTPLSVYLPFNMECLRGEFEPAKRGGGPPTGVGRWLVVQDQKLLVVPEGDGFRLPAGEARRPRRAGSRAGPASLARHVGGAPCWVAARPEGRAGARGLAAETLVPMQGTRLPDDLLTVGGMAMQLL